MYSRVTLVAALLCGCTTYSPQPIDIAAHAREFAARMPTAAAIHEFARQLGTRDPTAQSFDVRDGLSLEEARYVALFFNPTLRALRLRAGIARVSADEAGRWQDPELSADFAKILETVDHPWVIAGSLGFTVPLTGRLGLEKDLAASRHTQALWEARAAETRVLADLDLAWTKWSATELRLAQLRELLRRLEDLETIAKRLAAAHEITQIAARTFTLERTVRRGELIRLESAVATDVIDLMRLLGLPAETPIQLQPRTQISLRVALEQQRQQLLDGPRIALKRHDYEVAERQLALAIRKQWPDLTLFPGWQEEDGQPRAALGFSLPIPLWNRNAREIAEATAAREAVGEELRGEVERVTQDYAKAQTRLTSASARRALLATDLIPLAQQHVTEARQLANLGQLDTLLILDALTRAYDAQSAMLDSALEEAEASTEINSFYWPALTPGPSKETNR